MSDYIHKFICKNIPYKTYEEYVLEYNQMIDFEKHFQPDYSLYTRQMIEDEKRLESLIEKFDNEHDFEYYEE